MKLLHNKSLPLLLTAALVTVVLLWFTSAISHLRLDQAHENKQQLEQALTRAAVACYACEGVYPPDVSYLEEHYGVQIDHSLYTIKYEVIASNLMPDITVLENQP